MKRLGKAACDKEIAVFLLFYVPAIIYEYINPIFLHFWYNYLFALPTSILLTWALTTIHKTFRLKFLRVISLLGFFQSIHISLLTPIR